MAQGRIVSKKELEDFKGKYGQDMELRDFLNKERGLTRRKAKPVTKDVDADIAGQPMTENESAVSMDSINPNRSGRLNNPENKDLEGISTFKKGGSASSRADGIASKGKTRGKMC